MGKLEGKRAGKALSDSIKDGAASSVSSTLVSTYSIPFALLLGVNSAGIGILSAMPKLAGTLVQPAVGPIIKKLGGRKRMCVATSALSRLLLLVLVLLPFVFGPIFPDGQLAILVLIIILSLHQLFASSSITAWASWIGNIVPEKMRGKFFGRRGAYVGAAGFLTTLLGGLILGSFTGFTGFSIIFALAVASGIAGTLYLSRMPDPHPRDSADGHNAFRDLRTELKYNKNFKTFLVFSAAGAFAVQVASPFFVVSMLEDFKIGYEVFSVVTAASILATIVSQPYWGRLTDRYGDRTVIAICSAMTTLVPLLWMVVADPIHMILVYALAGFAWAGLDLAMFNYLLDVTPSNRRSAYIANYTMFVNTANFSGPLVGGLLAQMAAGGLLGFAGLQIVFFLSFVLRFFSTAIWVPQLKELRAQHPPAAAAIFWKAVTVYPVRFFTHEMAHAVHSMHHRPRLRGLSRVFS